MEMISSAKWVSDQLDVEESAFLDQYEMNPLDYSSLEDLNFQSFSSESYSSYQNFTPQQNGVDQRPAKQLKNKHSNWTTHDHKITDPIRTSTSASSHLISFGNSNSNSNSSSPPTMCHDDQYHYVLDCSTTTTVKPKIEAVQVSNKRKLVDLIPSKGNNIYPSQTFSQKPAYGQGIKKAATVTRSPLDAQDHVLAERKRREKLSELFIALSAIVPGLKKMDKASVLGDAVKYLKHLQERNKILEGQAAKKTVESVVFVKRTRYSPDEGVSSSDENFDQLALPEIEAKVSDKEVLIRIHCEKKKGCLANIVNEIEKLHLTVVNSSAMPFGNSTLDVTVVSQMDSDEISMTVKDLVRKLRQALFKLV